MAKLLNRSFVVLLGHLKGRVDGLVFLEMFLVDCSNRINERLLMTDVLTKGGAEGGIGTNDMMIANALSFFLGWI